MEQLRKAVLAFSAAVTAAGVALVGYAHGSGCGTVTYGQTYYVQPARAYYVQPAQVYYPAPAFSYEDPQKLIDAAMDKLKLADQERQLKAQDVQLQQLLKINALQAEIHQMKLMFQQGGNLPLPAQGPDGKPQAVLPAMPYAPQHLAPKKESRRLQAVKAHCAACHDEQKADAEGGGFVLLRGGQLPPLTDADELKIFRALSPRRDAKGAELPPRMPKGGGVLSPADRLDILSPG